MVETEKVKLSDFELGETLGTGKYFK